MMPPVDRHCRGMSDSVQWAVLAPLVFACIFMIIQAGAWMVGRSAIQQAAMTGAERAAILGNGPGDARGAALRVANEAGLREVTVVINDDGQRVIVEVRAELVTLLPGKLNRVAADATRMKEPS